MQTVKLSVFWLCFWGACLVLTGCGAKTHVLLLPEPDGSVGKVTVRAGGETLVLDQAYEGTQVGAPGRTAEKAGIWKEQKVKTLFGPAMAVQPKSPAVFVLYFNTGGTVLTQASQALMPDILESIQERQWVTISVVGHTDRVGSEQDNKVLAEKRAARVRDFLVENGVDPAMISTESHGEGNPLVPTADGVAEPKNRRVEVMVR